jgi:hypothetical protein
MIDQGFAQTPNDNYVKTYKATTAQVGDITLLNDVHRVNESTRYFDGLGREVQSIDRQGSPMVHDLVNFKSYDEYGRNVMSFLPFVSTETTGSFKVDPLASNGGFIAAALVP